MIELTFLQILWFVLLTVVLIGYYVLDGFDLGVGILFPFVAKTEDEQTIARNSIGPVWDGNEVWLLTVGGALFAAFPPAYATTFSGFYLAIMLVLFALIFRAVAIHYSATKEGSAQSFWNAMFFVGSLLPAILFGVAVGNLLNGVPLVANGDVAGGFPARFVQLLGVFPLLAGVLSLFMAILQGAGWLALKTHPSALHDRAVKTRNIFQYLTLAVFIVASAFYLLLVVPNLPEVGTHYMLGGAAAIIRIAAAIIAVVALLVAMFALRKRSVASFIASSLFVAFVIIVMAATLFPALVPAATPQFALMAAENVGNTIHVGQPFAASETALGAMAIIAAIGVPLVLIYHVIAYRIFSSKIDEETYDH